MSAKETFHRYLGECPLVAIIRGVRPDEAEAIGDAIYESGIRIIEVPLNSPEPFSSIERLSKRLGDRMLVGGGTVLTPDDVRRVRNAGGRIVISPNSNTDVIVETVAEGMISCPGYFTPSEAFAAIRAGATSLKLFPAEGASPALLKAHLAVIPREVPILIVGGVKPDSLRPWLQAGAAGFGLGGGLYKSGQSPSETLDKGSAYVRGLQA